MDLAGCSTSSPTVGSRGFWGAGGAGERRDSGGAQTRTPDDQGSRPRASSGAGAALILMGPAGIGQSRLARVAQRRRGGRRPCRDRSLRARAALRPFTEVALGLLDTTGADKGAVFDAVLRRLVPAGTPPPGAESGGGRRWPVARARRPAVGGHRNARRSRVPPRSPRPRPVVRADVAPGCPRRVVVVRRVAQRAAEIVEAPNARVPALPSTPPPPRDGGHHADGCTRSHTSGSTASDATLAPQ